jgi:hypothetical protein
VGGTPPASGLRVAWARQSSAMRCSTVHSAGLPVDRHSLMLITMVETRHGRPRGSPEPCGGLAVDLEELAEGDGDLLVLKAGGSPDHLATDVPRLIPCSTIRRGKSRTPHHRRLGLLGCLREASHTGSIVSRPRITDSSGAPHHLKLGDDICVPQPTRQPLGVRPLFVKE